jgi:hypothetical protein
MLVCQLPVGVKDWNRSELLSVGNRTYCAFSDWWEAAYRLRTKFGF